MKKTKIFSAIFSKFLVLKTSGNNFKKKRFFSAAFLSLIFIVTSLSLPIASGMSEVSAATHTYYVSNAGNDTASGTLSSPWKTIQKAADTAAAGDIVYVRGGTYHERVKVKNSGTATDYITFAAYPEETPTIDGTGLSFNDGLFNMNAQSYITIDGFSFTNSPSEGIYVRPGSDHINIRNNNFKSVFGSSPIGVGWDGPNNYILIENNEIDRTIPPSCTGEFDCWAEMISISGANEVVVRNNHIYRNERGEGIDFKDGTDNGQIYGNIVENTNSCSIYLDARGVVSNIDIHDNIVHVPTHSAFSLATEEIYPDTNRNPGSEIRNVNIYNNIVYDSLYGVRIGCYGASGGIIDGVNVINNVFYKTANDVGSADSKVSVSNVVFRNNIFNKSEMYLQKGVGATFDHNMFDMVCIGSDCVLGDPQFVNPASHDFHLKGISTAIDRGSSIGAPSVDFNGNARPQGAGYDIGAYEYTAASPTYLLTVVNGSGSGSYALGTNVTVTANTPSSGKVFDKWTGDISYVSDINSSTSKVTMPGKAISLIATYKDFDSQKASPTYLLTVVNGSGSGSYALGTNVTVTANTPSSGKVFDKWTGDISYVSDINSSTSKVMMPGKAISLIATYKNFNSQKKWKRWR